MFACVIRDLFLSEHHSLRWLERALHLADRFWDPDCGRWLLDARMYVDFLLLIKPTFLPSLYISCSSSCSLFTILLTTFAHLVLIAWRPNVLAFSSACFSVYGQYTCICLSYLVFISWWLYARLPWQWPQRSVTDGPEIWGTLEMTHISDLSHNPKRTIKHYNPKTSVGCLVAFIVMAFTTHLSHASVYSSSSPCF